MDFIPNAEEIDFLIDTIKLCFINIFTYYISNKIIDNKLTENKYQKIIICISAFLISIICSYIKYKINFLNSIICAIILLSVMFSLTSKKDAGDSFLIIMVSLSINYIIFFIAICITFFPSAIFNITNKYISLIILLTFYNLIIYLFSRINKFKKGLAFLKNKLKDEYMNILILNISVVILFCTILLSNYTEIITGNIGISFIIFSIIMFITIQKSLQLYYKQKLQQRELEDMRKELTKKNQEIKELEKENLNLSKTNHSISHKQKSLEYKLNQLILKNEIADEIDIKDRLSNISKELINNNTSTELKKTNITEIDDMLKYMQSECINNKIEFELQLNGNIHHMVNKYISKENLEILIADHIKNAIIAIKHSNNINRNILIRLGIIDGIYSIYIYDSGIEFEIETLLNLGKKPSTTHADTGGTGMGFMNTFDSLNKYKASIIIKEYGKPCKDNYTKSIQIKFDNKNQFIICSYRAEEIKEKSVDNSEILILKEE